MSDGRARPGPLVCYRNTPIVERNNPLTGGNLAKLTTKARKKIPSKSFAGPGRSYPIEDRAHAIDAKARAKQQFNKGRMSKSELASIDSKANKKLAGSKRKKA
jgi:hypothetical protein